MHSKSILASLALLSFAFTGVSSSDTSQPLTLRFCTDIDCHDDGAAETYDKEALINVCGPVPDGTGDYQSGGQIYNNPKMIGGADYQLYYECYFYTEEDCNKNKNGPHNKDWHFGHDYQKKLVYKSYKCGRNTGCNDKKCPGIHKDGE